MIPKAYTHEVSRSTLFWIVCLLGIVEVTSCAIDATVGTSIMPITASASILAIFIGVLFFGYPSLFPAAVLALVVRSTGFDFQTSLLMAVRDVVIAGTMALLWSRFQRAQSSPEKRHHPFASEEFESLLSALPDVIIVFDKDGTYREIFTGRADLLVRPADELLGKRLDEVLDKSTAQSGLDAIRQVIDLGTPMTKTHRLTINGETKWFHATAVPFNLRGEKTVLWVSRDVTDEKRIVEQQKKDEVFLRNLLRLQDRERKLISCEIHDGMLQHVIVAHLIAQVIARDVNPSNKKVVSNLATLQSTLSDAIREGRQLIQDLRPLVVDESGLVDALEGLVNEENQRGKITVSLKADGDFQSLPQMLEGSVYRIVQESLSNIRRHSQATAALISLVRANDKLEIRIQDNGVGFDRTKVNPDSFGLKSIESRAELFGGSADIDSAPGEGTRVVVRLPIEPVTEQNYDGSLSL